MPRRKPLPPEIESEHKPERHTRRRVALIGAVAVVIIAGTVAAVVFGIRGHDRSARLPQTTDELIAAVGRLIVLPTDERPTVATVNNLDVLRDKPLFRDAKVGDRVLIYAQAQKAVLYDPDADRIVEVAPFTLAPSPTP